MSSLHGDLALLFRFKPSAKNLQCANVQYRSPFVYSTLAIPAFAVYDV
jgi:hypothetical protein